ncbi:DUF4493 domain-containing protein [uncultured Alistipes sp.]|jgi:hypothetical protein|uniref:DUF4493 domain-containing protein n=1 Tax=uncultured Alistipes sp. TaxID=538949 RepID=UPI0025F0C508|nr:DUF4493 domain-containing protein [uncultured Alistipes sp.]
MKTFTKLLTMLATVALFATGCVNEDPHYKEDPGPTPSDNTGFLAFGDGALQVIYDTDTETQPDDAEETRKASVTRATPEVDDFIVEIFNSAKESVFKKTYAELKALTEPIELAVGAYSLEVRSEETMAAMAWENPFYGASREFAVVKAKTTTIDEVVCTLRNIKVTVGFPADLAAMLSASSVSTVTLGDNSAEFIKGETRAVYFKPLQEENTLTYALNGTYEDTGDPVKLSKTIEKVKAGQWRKITVKIESADKGSIRFRIVVNNLVQDDNISIDGTEGLWEEVIEENNDMPSIEWPGHDLTQPYKLTDAMFDAEGNYIGTLALDFESPNAIESLVVSIQSTSSAFMASLASIQIPETFDLCALSASSPAGIILKGFGYPLGDEVKGRTFRSFDIAGQMSMLYAFEGTHSFSFTVTDTNGRSATAALTLVVEQAGGQDAPTIVWRGYDIDQQYEIFDGMPIDIDVTAEAGIKSFWVTIDSEVLTPELPSIGIPVKFDLCNVEEDALIEILNTELGFPVNDQVKNQTFVPFSISQFVELLLMLPAGEHDFILDVTDNNDVTTTKTIQLVVK